MKLVTLLVAVVLVAIAVAAPSLGRDDGKRLIKVSEDKPAVWMGQDEILALIRKGQGFMDVTDIDTDAVKPQRVNTKAIPTTLKYNATVRNVMSKLNTGREQAFLKTFSDYHTRYYASDTGRASQLFLYGEVDASLRGFPGNATAYEVDHLFLQRSVVARLVGEDPLKQDEVVIVGAHIDSINGQNVTFRAPGADDNGAGVVCVLEALRAIVDAGITFKRTVEFHFYAAEEIGLVGSQLIASRYSKEGVDVVGMLNLDVISQYAEGVNDIAIITDYASPEMANFVRLLTNAYLDFGLRERVCGYGCSDHASWHSYNYPAIMGLEAISESWRHHTANDTYETVNFNQLNQFVYLTTSMIVEMAEPVNVNPL